MRLKARIELCCTCGITWSGIPPWPDAATRAEWQRLHGTDSPGGPHAPCACPQTNFKEKRNAH
jgi:hypothetical protein